MFWQELAQKIRGYQEQIASLHSKCKMLTVKAKHATMLLTVNDVDGLSDGMDELSDDELSSPVAVSTNATTNAGSKQLPAHPSVVMVSSKACSGHMYYHTDTHTYSYHMSQAHRCVWFSSSILQKPLN